MDTLAKKKKKKLLFFDTTLRDGSQAEGVSFSRADKVKIAKILDEWGMDYIEGGWPGSNPKDITFFRDMQDVKLKHAKLTAFGSTAHPKYRPEEDPNLLALVESKTPAVAIFGKSWDLHAREALRVPLDKNLQLIHDSIKFLTSKGIEVVFDAEHFFDGFKANSEYALKALQAALEGGAANLTLADTNGGNLPHFIAEASSEVRQVFPDANIGAHCHNDSGNGVANSIVIVMEGGNLVQGTINGIGERCGNADLVSIIPNLLLKDFPEYEYDAKIKKNINQLSSISREIAEIANLSFNERSPFVGKSAFAHKGGIHVSAVARNPIMYEHMDPSIVGNERRVLVSELSGKSNLVYKAEDLSLDLKQYPDKSKEIVAQVKDKENEGYHYEGAEASLELLVQKIIGTYKPSFTLHGYRVFIDRHPLDFQDGDYIFDETICEAVIEIEVQGQREHTVANGNGPVQALNKALRKALKNFYPQVEQVDLSDYKVRVIGESEGAGSAVRVLVDHKKGSTSWSTTGVHHNIITASWLALVDGIEYFLFKHQAKVKGF